MRHYSEKYYRNLYKELMKDIKRAEFRQRHVLDKLSGETREIVEAGTTQSRAEGLDYKQFKQIYKAFSEVGERPMEKIREMYLAPITKNNAVNAEISILRAMGDTTTTKQQLRMMSTSDFVALHPEVDEAINQYYRERRNQGASSTQVRDEIAEYWFGS